jgi:serine/threonine protein kinase
VTTFTPEVFGKYFLVDKIATGGMAEIFKAKTFSHGGFEHLLVIKRILAHLGDNEDFVEMFIDEAKVSVALQHANIIRIYDFGKILDNYFIAMEWVDGRDTRNLLKKLSRQRKFLPIEFAAFIAHETSKGLEYAHRKSDLGGHAYGIVHRDVSPSNVLVSYEGDVKIADFGIAKAESNAYNTRDGVLKGKFEYMSPEQAEGIEIDHRSDIFSLGIILHEMLTGRRLFKTGNEAATLEKIKRGELQAPSALHTRVPEKLDRIVMKALSRDREERYQSAKEMQDDLLQFLYPRTADMIRQELALFMAEVFAEDMAEERKRLTVGSEAAERLRRSTPMPDAWDGHTNSTLSNSQAAPAGGVIPWVFAGGLAIVLLLLVTVVTGVGISTWAQEAPVEIAATTGGIDVLILPAGRIYVDNALVGEADALAVADLPPGQHEVRIEAEGYETLQEPVAIVAGKLTSFRRTLKEAPKAAPPPPVVAPTPTPPSNVASAPPRAEVPAQSAVARFDSTPSGATVVVDGQALGTTPLTWSEGTVGGRYAVEYRLDGHQSATGTLTGLTAGRATIFLLALQPEVELPGKLNVAIVGGGWANVWVDGEKLAKTAPLSGYELPAGSHSIRVENASLGVDSTSVVEVQAGEVAKVSVRPD